MKKVIFLSAIICLLATVQSFSQKYKTAEDTIKLNKEYLNLSYDIADLNLQLVKAQSKKPDYQSKVNATNTDAQQSAQKSSEQANKATNGNLKDAKRSKKEAGKALDDAEDAKNAREDVKDLDKKISKLSEALQKKQAKLQELENMRTAIRALPQ